MKPSAFNLASLESKFGSESFHALVDMMDDMDLEIINVISGQ